MRKYLYTGDRDTGRAKVETHLQWNVNDEPTSDRDALRSILLDAQSLLEDLELPQDRAARCRELISTAKAIADYNLDADYGNCDADLRHNLVNSFVHQASKFNVVGNPGHQYTRLAQRQGVCREYSRHTWQYRLQFFDRSRLLQYGYKPCPVSAQGHSKQRLLERSKKREQRSPLIRG